MWGQCEAVGACSFPDTSCESQRRYGAQSDPAVANLCVVEEEPAEPASESDDREADTAAPADAGDTAEPDESGDIAPGSSSGEASSTGDETSTSEDSDPAAVEGSSSTGDALDCHLDLLAEFFDQPLSPCWAVWGTNGLPPVLEEGALVFEDEVSTLSTIVQRNLRGTAIEVDVIRWGFETSITVTRGAEDITAVTAQRGPEDGLEVYIHDQSTVGGPPVLRFASLDTTGLRVEEHRGEVLISTAQDGDWELLHTASGGPEWDFGTLAISARPGVTTTALDTVEVLP